VARIVSSSNLGLQSCLRLFRRSLWTFSVFIFSSLSLQETQKFLPPTSYSCLRGKGTWEVSDTGGPIAKRSFLKYGGEDMAAKRVLWEAWSHHARCTDQPCQVAWLQATFAVAVDSQALRQEVAANLDATTLADIARNRLPKHPEQVKSRKNGQALRRHGRA
jgi:hypothetical protein